MSMTDPSNIELSKTHREGTEFSPNVSTIKLEAALRRTMEKSRRYDHDMKDLEAKLGENLSNFRAVDTTLRETVTKLTNNTSRARAAYEEQAPQIKTELRETLEDLRRLETEYPRRKEGIKKIGVLYDSGRKKGNLLLDDLTWLNTDFLERWRKIIFSSSPVALRWKVTMRLIFSISLLLCAWLAWIALLGGIRAYKHRLMWGDRLMS